VAEGVVGAVAAVADFGGKGTGVAGGIVDDGPVTDVANFELRRKEIV